MCEADFPDIVMGKTEEDSGAEGDGEIMSIPTAPALCTGPAGAQTFTEMAESREKERCGGKSKVMLWTCHVCDDCENSKGRCRVGV